MDFMVKCCECNRVRISETWIPEKSLVTGPVVFSHSYCPDCLRKIMQDIESWSPSQEWAPETALHPALDG